MGHSTISSSNDNEPFAAAETAAPEVSPPTRTRRPREERAPRRQPVRKAPSQAHSDPQDQFVEPVHEATPSYSGYDSEEGFYSRSDTRCDTRSDHHRAEVRADTRADNRSGEVNHEARILPPPVMVPFAHANQNAPQQNHANQSGSYERPQRRQNNRDNNRDNGPSNNGYGQREQRQEPRQERGANNRQDRGQDNRQDRQVDNNRQDRQPDNNRQDNRSQDNNRQDNRGQEFRKNRTSRDGMRQNGRSSRDQRPDMYDDDDTDNLVIELNADDPSLVRIAQLQRMNVEQLLQFAKAENVELTSVSLMKSQMVFEIVRTLSFSPDTIIVGEGTLEILPDGYGFLRSPIYNYLSSVEDIYVSPAQVRKLDLRRGDTIVGTIRSPREREKYFALAKVDRINGVSPTRIKERMLFENLTPLYPQERLVMETDRNNYTGRIIDLAAPIGKGQRGMVVAPPRSGKTIIMQQMANSIARNNPEVFLIFLMIGERPEEVTDMLRTIKGEVIASTFDEPPERHVQVAEMVIEKARRLVEFGHDVVILLDSITRLARAYNTVEPHSGKILSGGVDANALHKPKRFFGAARNIEEGGSLTIIASALIETGSRMDEVIFEEFKGTGNMEVVLDRRLADRRIWPAIDPIRSGTRKEDLLYHPSELEKIYLFRQAIGDLSPQDAMNLLLGRLKKTSSNVEFLLTLKD